MNPTKDLRSIGINMEERFNVDNLPGIKDWEVNYLLICFLLVFILKN